MTGIHSKITTQGQIFVPAEARRQLGVGPGSVPASAWVSQLVLEIARKAGYLPLGTFGRALSKLEGAERL